MNEQEFNAAMDALRARIVEAQTRMTVAYEARIDAEIAMLVAAKDAYVRGKAYYESLFVDAG
jgi:hypothetical protein